MKIIMSLGNQTFNTEHTLQQKITNKRNEMFELAQAYGLNHELTVEKSQELDVLINEWLRQHSDMGLTEIA